MIRRTILAVAPLAAAAALIPGAAHAAATAPGASASGTLWIGPQAVSLSIGVSGPTGGVPHPCVTNNGPDEITVIGYSVTDARHTIYVNSRNVTRGGSYCWAKGAVTLPARLYVAATDQRTGNTNVTTLTVQPVGTAPAPRHRHHHHARHHHRHHARHHHTAPLQPVRYTGIVAGVQTAVGVAADGDWGPNTDAAVNRLRAAAHNHYGVQTARVAAFQTAVGVPADGRWGPVTDDQWMLARNAAGWRY